jgi:hypothetical protein
VNGPPTGFCWLKADPNKDIAAIEIARQRRIEEAQPNQCRSGLTAAQSR